MPNMKNVLKLKELRLNVPKILAHLFFAHVQHIIPGTYVKNFGINNLAHFLAKCAQIYHLASVLPVKKF